MSIIVAAYGRLKGDAEEIGKMHDKVAEEGAKQAALALGEIQHTVYLGLKDDRMFFSLDEWESEEAFQKFAEGPVKEFFDNAFESLDITMWKESGWMKWKR